MGTIELQAGTDFIFAIDVSASMNTQDCPNNLSRFIFSMEKTMQFCEQADKIDDDGISVYAFGHDIEGFENVSNAKVVDVINQLKPSQSATLTELAIRKAYKEHKDGGNTRTVLFLVTDGEPTCAQDVINELDAIRTKQNEKFAAKKEDFNFHVCFLTVGNVSASLRAFLDKLKSYSFCEVQELESANFYAAVGGAMNGD